MASIAQRAQRRPAAVSAVLFQLLAQIPVQIPVQILVPVPVALLCAAPLAAQSATGMRSSPGAPANLQPYASPLAWAVPSPAAPPATADALLEQMSLAAGVIFAGEVTAVRRPPGFAGSAQDAAEGIVEIDLRVDRPLRGPAAGSTYTLREWAGLWAGQAQRYRAGQRLLLFLYPPDARGLTSPVHGAEGAIPLRGSGAAPGPDDATPAAAEWLVDLRWLQAQLARRRGLATPPVRDRVIRQPGLRPASAPVDAQPLSQPLSEPLSRPLSEPLSQPLSEPLSQVLAICRDAVTPDPTRRRDAGR